MQFEHIKNVDVNNRETWEDKIFLTFDIDWASDEVITFTLDIIERYDVKATFFITHNTRLLQRMRENPNIELGIHPNFNLLLNGNISQGKNLHEVIEQCLKIVPDAVSVRSHSMVQSTPILDAFVKYGLRFEVNHFIPLNANIEMIPWLLWNKLIKVPYFWEDDICCAYSLNGWMDGWNIPLHLSYKGIKVFDFHPIHIFLNTDELNRYEMARKCFDSPEKLAEYRYPGNGIKTQFDTLIGIVS